MGLYLALFEGKRIKPWSFVFSFSPGLMTLLSGELREMRDWSREQVFHACRDGHPMLLFIYMYSSKRGSSENLGEGTSRPDFR